MAQKLHVIIGSTRPGRVGPSIAKWFHAAAKAHGVFDAELVDIHDFIVGGRSRCASWRPARRRADAPERSCFSLPGREAGADKAGAGSIRKVEVPVDFDLSAVTARVFSILNTQAGGGHVAVAEAFKLCGD